MSSPSGSSLIYDHLLTVDKDAEFNAEMLVTDLDVSPGAATGFLAKAAQAGAIRVTGREGRSSSYVVVDMSKIAVRRSAGAGSNPGRSHSGTTSSKQVASLLRSLADQIEGMKSGLEDYSNMDLIRELSRRERTVKGAD